MAKGQTTTKAKEKVAEKVEPKADSTNIINNVQAKLEKEAVTNTAKTNSNQATPEQAQQLDITKLSDAQLRQLNARLQSTSVKTESNIKKESVATLRVWEGRVVVGLKDSYEKLTEDPIRGTKNMVILMPVLLLGDVDYKEVPLAEFMSAPRVNVTFKYKQEFEDINLGQTYSKDLGTMVDMFQRVPVQKNALVMYNEEELTVPITVLNA